MFTEHLSCAKPVLDSGVTEMAQDSLCLHVASEGG